MENVIKNIPTRANEKPWMTQEVREKLKVQNEPTSTVYRGCHFLCFPLELGTSGGEQQSCINAAC